MKFLQKLPFVTHGMAYGGGVTTALGVLKPGAAPRGGGGGGGVGRGAIAPPFLFWGEKFM